MSALLEIMDKKNRVLVDYRTDNESIDELNKLGLNVYKTSPLNSLYNEVSGHPDMQIHFINNAAFCAPENYEYYSSFQFDNLKLVHCTKSLSGKYPYDIAYNVCNVGNYVCCRASYTALEILSTYRSLNKEIVNVNQGYAKCNICIVSKKAIITSDDSIYRALHSKDIDILKIKKGYIELYNMEGFIGGASGLINEKILCFNGDLKTHPDCDNIISFAKNSGVDVISLNKGNLKDIGSIIQF